MARQYGNKTGAYSDPSGGSAPGQWVSPTEVIRNKSLNRWPAVQVGVPPIYAGTYVYSIASGISDTLVAGGNFYVADGSARGRTGDSLFAAIGTTYGNGNGANTFNIPNLSSRPYNHLKSVTTSGLSLASLSGVAVIPGHTHSTQGINGNTSVPTNGLGGPGGAIRNANTTVSNTLFTGSTGDFLDDLGNQPRRRETQILIAKNTVTAPIGAVIPALLPIDHISFNAQLSPNFLIPSGQDVSRTVYDTLFGMIGTKFGNGNGVTTFTLPDLRGLFLSGVPTSVPDVSGVLPSGYLIDTVAKHNHLANLRTPTQGNASPNNTGNLGNTMVAPATGASSIAGSETRPANISVVWLLVAS